MCFLPSIRPQAILRWRAAIDLQGPRYQGQGQPDKRVVGSTNWRAERLPATTAEREAAFTLRSDERLGDCKCRTRATVVMKSTQMVREMFTGHVMDFHRTKGTFTGQQGRSQEDGMKSDQNGNRRMEVGTYKLQLPPSHDQSENSHTRDRTLRSHPERSWNGQEERSQKYERRNDHTIMEEK